MVPAVCGVTVPVPVRDGISVIDPEAAPRYSLCPARESSRVAAPLSVATPVRLIELIMGRPAAVAAGIAVPDVTSVTVSGVPAVTVDGAFIVALTVSDASPCWYELKSQL
jgi:hypothetical protein